MYKVKYLINVYLVFYFCNILIDLMIIIVFIFVIKRYKYSKKKFYIMLGVDLKVMIMYCVFYGYCIIVINMNCNLFNYICNLNLNGKFDWRILKLEIMKFVLFLNLVIYCGIESYNINLFFKIIYFCCFVNLKFIGWL